MALYDSLLGNLVRIDDPCTAAWKYFFSISTVLFEQLLRITWESHVSCRGPVCYQLEGTLSTCEVPGFAVLFLVSSINASVLIFRIIGAQISIALSFSLYPLNCTVSDFDYLAYQQLFLTTFIHLPFEKALENVLIFLAITAWTFILCCAAFINLIHFACWNSFAMLISAAKDQKAQNFDKSVKFLPRNDISFECYLKIQFLL